MVRLSRSLAAAIAVAVIAPALPAQTSATWSQTAAGTYDWPNNANWGGNPFPDGGGTANLNNDIAGAQTVNLNQLITLGALNIGDASGTSVFTVAPGTGGSLAFTGGATVTAQGGANVISAPVAFGSTITFAGTTGSLNFSGLVTGTGTGLTKTGPTELIFGNSANSFNHAITVSGGRINATNATAGTPFGTGSITLDDGVLRAALTTAAGQNVSLTAAGGTGGTFTFAGGSNIVLNKNTGAGSTLTLTIGDPAAAASSLVRSGRGTLAIATVSPIGAAATGTERLFVNGGVPTVSPGGTNPNTYVPAYMNSILSSGGTTTADFLTYNATNGFQIATYTSTDITTSTATDVVNQTTAATLTGPAQAFGLKNTQALNLNGNTLTLGNGSGTAGLYLSSAVPATTPSLNGPGTVAFGGAEGVLFIPGNTPITGDITFTGTNGLTMFSTANSANARAGIRNNVTVATNLDAQMGIILAETGAGTGPFTAVLKVGTPSAPAAFNMSAPASFNANPGFMYLGFRNSATGGNSNGTLDLADATSVNIETQNIHVGRSTSQAGAGASTGALLLPTLLTAPVNISATSFIAVGGDNQSSPASNGLPTAQIVFGAGTNTVVTPLVEIGGFNSDANVTIRPGGSLVLSGPNNTATNLLMSDNAIGTTAATFAATTNFDLTGGRITANFGTVQLGVGNATGTGAATATFTVDGATSAVTIATATLGNVRGTGDASGTLIVNNGSVTIGTLNLTSQNGTGAASGTLRLANSATVTLNGPIVTTTGVGAGPRTTTIDLLGGTLNTQNNDVGDVTTFNFAGGTLQNPGTITRSAGAFTQTGGTLVRNTAGTTTIAGGAYNLTAPAVANVSAGTLLVNGSTGSAPGTGTVNVTGSGTLGGTGTVNGNVVVSTTVAGTQGGTLSPGASIGTLTVGSGAMTWNPGGSYLFEHNVQAASPATPGVDNDYVTSAGALNLANLTPGSFNLNLAPTNIPASPTTFTPVQYTLGTFAGGVTGPGGADLSGQTITNLFNFSGLFGSPPSVTVSPAGGNVILTFTPVPEPAGVLAACGAVGLLGWVRQRMRRNPTPA